MKEKEKGSKPTSSAGPPADREPDFPRFRIDVMTKSDKALPDDLRVLGNIEVQHKVKRDKDRP